MKKRKGLMLIVLALLVVLSVIPTQAAKVKLNKKTATIQVGKTLKLKVKGKKKKDKCKFKSSNKKVATVTKKGVVKGVRAGSATIAVKVGKKTLKCKVKVVDPKAAREKAAREKAAREKAAREKAAREKAAREKAAREKAAKEKAAKEKAAKDKAAADAVIAKINAIGTVAFNSASKTKIDNARSAYNALTSDQKVLVTNYGTLTNAEEAYAAFVPVTEVNFYDSYKSINMGVGGTEKISYSVSPYDATDDSITWTTSNSAVATVDSSGTVTGVSRGTATITATAHNGIKATSTVKVHDVIITYPALPTTITYYGSGSTVYSRCSVKKIEFEKHYFKSDNEFSVKMFITGTKTYDYKPNVSSSCKIGWKLYDSDNIVVKSGTLYSTTVGVNESFKDYDYIGTDLPEGVYRLELLNVV